MLHYGKKSLNKTVPDRFSLATSPKATGGQSEIYWRPVQISLAAILNVAGAQIRMSLTTSPKFTGGQSEYHLRPVRMSLAASPIVTGDQYTCPQRPTRMSLAAHNNVARSQSEYHWRWSEFPRSPRKSLTAWGIFLIVSGTTFLNLFP